MSRTGYVQLAPAHRTDHTISVRVDAAGQVRVNGDVWVPILDGFTLAVTLLQLGVPRDATRAEVFAALTLKGYWPGLYALDAYMRGDV